MAQQSIAQTVTEGSRVRIVYLDPQGEISERVIDVERIFTHEQTGNRLVVAFCWRRRALRTFNMRGILAAMPDDSVMIASFGMIAAVTRSDAHGFMVARNAVLATA